MCTEQCDFHVTGDTQPYTETNLWDEGDETYLGRMAEAVHRHGSLAGIELVHNGQDSGNLYSREMPIGPAHRPVTWLRHPIQARAMDLADIRAYRRWHRTAALRARDMGFDMVIVYAGHNGTMPGHFLARRHNDRTRRIWRQPGEPPAPVPRADRGNQGGSRRHHGGDRALRRRRNDGPGRARMAAEGREAVEMLAELPDLWDVNVSDWANDSKTSRFAPEGYQEDYVAFVKKVTTKPVAIVGRYTSPDAMVSAIRRGITDLIGAARPSIADPFLPSKIEEGARRHPRVHRLQHLRRPGTTCRPPRAAPRTRLSGRNGARAGIPSVWQRAGAKSPCADRRRRTGGLEAARTAGLAGYQRDAGRGR